MRLTRKKVAALLGHQSTAMLSRYESGRSTPPLLTALMLEAIYRTPLAYLYYGLYAEVREHVRRLEGNPSIPYQPTLFGN